MSLHLLLTDYLVIFLVLATLAFALYARKHEHLRAPWRQVFQSHVGAATAVILSVYALIGVLDSVHYYPHQQNKQGESVASGELVSVFDWLVTPLRIQVETSYSAPFAQRSFVKETIETNTGTQERVFPRLKYGGQHLANEESVTSDIIQKAVFGALYGLLFTVLLILLLAFVISRFSLYQTKTLLKKLVMLNDAKRTGAFVLLACGALLGASYYLSLFYHVWGTDKVGYDVFYITLKSIRTGLVIGTLTTLVMLPFALALGMAAGYFKGWIDDVVQYIYTTLNSVPDVLLIAAAVLMLDVYMYNHADQFTSVIERADWRLFFICLIMGITNWTGLCRLLRAETLKLREMDYVTAATAFGVKHRTVLLRHILPNVMHIVLITIVLGFSGLVLAEAFLSYVGIGVDPTTHSWGNMINSARLEMAREPMVWWILVSSFVAMFTLVLCANLFTDVVRDAFDPRLRERS